MKTKYDVGDEAWIFAGERNEKGIPQTSKGKVIMAFYTPLRALEQYIILLDDPDFLAMEVRDHHTMSDTADGWPSYTEFQRPRLTRRISGNRPN